LVVRTGTGLHIPPYLETEGEPDQLLSLESGSRWRRMLINSASHRGSGIPHASEPCVGLSADLTTISHGHGSPSRNSNQVWPSGARVCKRSICWLTTQKKGGGPRHLGSVGRRAGLGAPGHATMISRSGTPAHSSQSLHVPVSGRRPQCREHDGRSGRSLIRRPTLQRHRAHGIRRREGHAAQSRPTGPWPDVRELAWP